MVVSFFFSFPLNTDVRPHPPAPKNRLMGESHLRVCMTPLAAAAVTARQAPEEQLLHQQTLTVAEYLMLHLFKAPLRFRSNLHHQGERGERKEGKQRPLLSTVRDARNREETTHLNSSGCPPGVSAAHKNTLPRLIFYLTLFLPPPPKFAIRH